MKRIVALMLFLLLVACAKPTGQEEAQELPDTASGQAQEVAKTPEPQASEAGQVSEPEVGRKPPAMTPPFEKVVTQTAPDTTVSAPKAELSPQIRDLLKRSQEKLTSVQYLYGGTATKGLFLNTYLVKGDKRKIKLYEENYYVRDGYYDNVYVNLAVGCCEEQARCKSHNVDNTGKKFDVDVAALGFPRTPMEWMQDIESNAIVVGPQTFNSRSVTHIKYVRPDGVEVLMWVDDTYGVPHKVVFMKDGAETEKHQFNDMKFNGLKDAEFDAPCD